MANSKKISTKFNITSQNQFNIQNSTTFTSGTDNNFALTRNSFQYSISSLIIGHEYQVDFEAYANDHGRVTIGPNGIRFTASTNQQKILLYLEKNANIHQTYVQAKVHDITDNTFYTDSVIMKTDEIAQLQCEELKFPNVELYVEQPLTIEYLEDTSSLGFSVRAVVTGTAEGEDVPNITYSWGIKRKSDEVYKPLDTRGGTNEFVLDGFNYTDDKDAEVMVIIRAGQEIVPLKITGKITLPQGRIVTHKISPGYDRAFNTVNDTLSYSRTISMSDGAPISYDIEKFVYERPLSVRMPANHLESFLDDPNFSTTLVEDLAKSRNNETSFFRKMGTIDSTPFKNGRVEATLSDKNFKNFFKTHPYGIRRTVLKGTTIENISISTVIAYVFKAYTKDDQGNKKLVSEWTVMKSIQRIIISEQSRTLNSTINHDSFNTVAVNPVGWGSFTTPIELILSPNHMYTQSPWGAPLLRRRSFADFPDASNTSNPEPSINFKLKKNIADAIYYATNPTELPDITEEEEPTVEVTGPRETVTRTYSVREAFRSPSLPSMAFYQGFSREYTSFLSHTNNYPYRSFAESQRNNPASPHYNLSDIILRNLFLDPFGNFSVMPDDIDISMRSPLHHETWSTNIFVKKGDTLKFKQVPDNFGKLDTLYTQVILDENGERENIFHDANGLKVPNNGLERQYRSIGGLTLIPSLSIGHFKNMDYHMASPLNLSTQFEGGNRTNRYPSVPYPRQPSHPKYRGGRGWPKNYVNKMNLDFIIDGNGNTIGKPFSSPADDSAIFFKCIDKTIDDNSHAHTENRSTAMYLDVRKIKNTNVNLYNRLMCATAEASLSPRIIKNIDYNGMIIWISTDGQLRSTPGTGVYLSTNQELELKSNRLIVMTSICPSDNPEETAGFSRYRLFTGQRYIAHNSFQSDVFNPNRLTNQYHVYMSFVDRFNNAKHTERLGTYNVSDLPPASTQLYCDESKYPDTKYPYGYGITGDIDSPLIMPIPDRPPGTSNVNNSSVLWSPVCNTIRYGGETNVQNLLYHKKMQNNWSFFSNFVEAYIDYFITPGDNNKYVLVNELDQADDVVSQITEGNHPGDTPGNEANPYFAWENKDIAICYKKIRSALTTTHPGLTLLKANYGGYPGPGVTLNKAEKATKGLLPNLLTSAGWTASMHRNFIKNKSLRSLPAIQEARFRSGDISKLEDRGVGHIYHWLAQTSNQSAKHEAPPIVTSPEDTLAKLQGVCAIIMPPATSTNPYPRGVAFPVGTEAEITNIPIDGELRLFIPQGESFACQSNPNHNPSYASYADTTIDRADYAGRDSAHVSGKFSMSVTYTKTDASSLNTDDTNALSVMEVDAKLVNDNTPLFANVNSYGISNSTYHYTYPIIYLDSSDTGLLAVKLADVLNNQAATDFENAKYKLHISVPGADDDQILYKFTDTSGSTRYKLVSEINNTYPTEELGELLTVTTNFERNESDVINKAQYKIHSILNQTVDNFGQTRDYHVGLPPGASVAYHKITVHANDVNADPNVKFLGLGQPMLQWYVEDEEGISHKIGPAIELPKTAVRESLRLDANTISQYPNWIFYNSKVFAEVYQKEDIDNKVISDRISLADDSIQNNNDAYNPIILAPMVADFSTIGNVLPGSIRSTNTLNLRYGIDSDFKANERMERGELRVVLPDVFKPSIRQVLADENPAVLSAPVQVKIRLGASGPIATLGVPGTYDPELTEILTNSEDAMSDSVNNFAFQGVGNNFFNIPTRDHLQLGSNILQFDAELLNVTQYIMDTYNIANPFSTGAGFSPIGDGGYYSDNVILPNNYRKANEVNFRRGILNSHGMFQVPVYDNEALSHISRNQTHITDYWVRALYGLYGTDPLTTPETYENIINYIRQFDFMQGVFTQNGITNLISYHYNGYLSHGVCGIQDNHDYIPDITKYVGDSISTQLCILLNQTHGYPHNDRSPYQIPDTYAEPCTAFPDTKYNPAKDPTFKDGLKVNNTSTDTYPLTLDTDGTGILSICFSDKRLIGTESPTDVFGQGTYDSINGTDGTVWYIPVYMSINNKGFFDTGGLFEWGQIT